MRVSTPSGSTRKASLAALASSLLFAGTAIVARLLSRNIPGPQIALVRFATGVVVVLFAFALSRVELRPRRWGWLVSRGVFGGTAVLLYYSCIEKIGVGVATLLNYTAPVWSTLFAWILLHERPHPRTGVALALTLVGVALVAGGPAHTSTFHLDGWQILGVLSAVLSGMAITSVRATRKQTAGGDAGESTWTVFASFTLLGTFITLPAVFPPVGVWVKPTTTLWVLLVACGLLSIAAQLLMTAALGRLTAAGIGIINQTTVVLAMAGGLVFFGETISLRGAVGSILTVAGVVWLMLSDAAV